MDIDTVAVLGSGTMGAGIAQAVLAAELPVVLYDVSHAALEHARERIALGLIRQGVGGALNRLRLAAALEEVTGATLVIEAVPEQLDLKRDLFAKVGAICPAPCVIASNTSSLPVTLLGAACPGPQRVAGLHFFNPVHRMALVEVIRAGQTDEATITTLLEFARRLGKTPVLARDTPGFIVNRVARPYYGEALRLLGEGAASHEAIDTALHLAGGFPLGPFALMDLIGIDVNFAVTRSMYEQSFGEPRYRPHPIQQQMVVQGRLGRKIGQGFYAYAHQAAAGSRQAAGDAVPRPLAAGSLIVSGGSWGPHIAGLAAAAGFGLITGAPADQGLQEAAARGFDPAALAHDSVRAALVLAGQAEGAAANVVAFDHHLPAGVVIFAQCADITAGQLAAQVAHPERLVGFDGLFTDGAMTLVATPLLSDAARAAADALVRDLGRQPIWIADSPALIVPRVVAQLANEAAFAVGEGVADAETVDTAMRLGANHPAGPLARARVLGYNKIVAILDHLQTEFGEERYRVAPLLRRAARLGQWS